VTGQAVTDLGATDRVTEARAAEIFSGCRNWGRWGPDDERGALNLLTPDRVGRAAGLARAGRALSLGRDLAVQSSPDNPTPALHHMTVAADVGGFGQGMGMGGSADFVAVACHGMAQSHIDALCHVFVGGEMWNGHPASEVTSVGARRNSIRSGFDGITGRGVLLDVPRLRHQAYLEPGEAVSPDELDRCCIQQGVSVKQGDILLVSTGRDARREVEGPWDPVTVGLAGLDPECIPWLHEKDPSVLGSDGVSDPLPANSHTWPMPVHMCLLVGMGVHLLDNLQLGRLANACADEGRWEFLITVAPLRISGGTGSPVNPIAVL
jgi:kynurenine formamidase